MEIESRVLPSGLTVSRYFVAYFLLKQPLVNSYDELNFKLNFICFKTRPFPSYIHTYKHKNKTYKNHF